MYHFLKVFEDFIIMNCLVVDISLAEMPSFNAISF